MTIQEYNFKGKRALIRVDFNVPIDKATKNVSDDTRIRLAIPTIKKVLADGGSVVLMSHMGRPKNCPEEKFSLKQIISSVNNCLGTQIKFVDDCISSESFELSSNLKSGEVLLLENLRFYLARKKVTINLQKNFQNMEMFLLMMLLVLLTEHMHLQL